MSRRNHISPFFTENLNLLSLLPADSPGTLVTHRANVSRAAEIEALVNAATQRFGRLNVAVSNAAFMRDGSVVDLPESDWDDMFATNVKGSFLLGKYGVPAMRKAGGGSFVIMASVNGATQIRAGVIRPEIIIPRPGKIMAKVGAENGDESNLEVGARVRVIREPYFGKLGEVTSLPAELQVLDSESKVRVLGVKFDVGGEDVIPRANVELIETGRR